MPAYDCTDRNALVAIEADSPKEAAQEYVDGGGFQQEVTTWVTVYVTEEDEDGDTIDHGRIKITVEPNEPYCVNRNENHEWDSPHEIVGGLKENPGVYGSGGGVKYTVVCMKCGCGKHVNTWDYDPNDGEQGLTSVQYIKGEYTDALSLS